MSDSDEERAPGVLPSRRASGCQQHVTQTPSTRLRRKEVPRDFLKGKIEKFTGKLERAKSSGNEEDIKKCRPASQKPPSHRRDRRDAIDATPSTRRRRRDDIDATSP